MDFRIFLTIFVLIQSCFGKYEEYISASVHGVVLRNQDDVALLRNLEAEFELDLWRGGVPGSRDAHIMVLPQYKEKFLSALDQHGIKHYVHKSDVNRELQNFERSFSEWKLRRTNTPIYNTYARYGEIEEYLDRLGREYPNLVTVVNAGNSFENRPLKYVKISTTNFQDPSKPIYFMDAAMHSREWVTTPVALYTIHRLVEDLRDQDRDLLENIDWVIMPVMNPDGYEYSHTENRMWRRTRSFNSSISSNCYGADLNRNFDIFFGTISVSNNPCSDIWPGPFPFSEVESQHVRDMFFMYLDRIQIYMNMHSYGNYILYGFDNKTLPHNVAQLHHVAASMGAHIDTRKLPVATYYLVGNGDFVLYGASGTSQDYAQDIGVPFSYTLELPDFQAYDFLVPPEYIEQINTETFVGIAETARLSNLFYHARR